jgi:hypothetical protein
MAIQISDRVKVEFPDEQYVGSLLSPQEYADVATQLATKAITGMVAAPISPYVKLAAGTALYASEVTLTIADIAYRFRFRLITTRAIAAAEVFNESLQWLDAMKNSGRMDGEVADITRSHLLYKLRQINRS